MAAKKKTKKKVTKKAGKAARTVSTRKKAAPAAKRRTATKAKAAVGKPRRAARRTRDAIMAILEEAKSRGSNAEVIRKHNLSPTTFYSWKRKHGTSRRKRK